MCEKGAAGGVKLSMKARAALAALTCVPEIGMLH